MDGRRIVNGFVVGATSVVVLWAAEATQAEPPIDLADVAAGAGGFVMNGRGSGDQAGCSVSGAGDVNGDGVPDVIVGAWRAGPGGESYVVFGKADGTPVDLADVVSGNGGFVIIGAEGGDFTGQSVSGVGDVNGDGLADVIVGGNAWVSWNCEGRSYVVFGKADGAPVDLADVIAGDGGFFIEGADECDWAGACVSGAGDVNGDGVPDVIVGAPYATPHGIDSGASYVVFGKSDGTPVALADLEAGLGGGFVMNGISADDDSARSVTGVGDMNGDGLADVIVGARGAFAGTPNAGESYVVFGKADGTPVELSDVANGIGGFVINGNHADDESGSKVSGIGDMNGDGVPDVIVSAPYADPHGECYVVFGKADGTPVELADVIAGNGGFVINGAVARLGGGSGAGDVNGDGVPDVIVASALAHGQTGEIYVVYGKSDGTPVEIADVVAGDGGFVITGSDPYDQAGRGTGVGDMNGDGLADLVVGAVQNAYGNPGTGKAYVVFSPVTICPADLDGNGDVDFQDLLALLFAWGPCAGCDEDVDSDGVVGFADLVFLLFAWGPCQSGACCFDDGACLDGSPSECLSAGGIYFGNGTLCADAICPQPGACCLLDGRCVSSSPGGGSCTLQGGWYQGDGSLCADVECQPGACCLPDGTCVASSPGGDDCAALDGVYFGDGSLCADITCPQGACCLPDFGCFIGLEAGCNAAGGSFVGEDTICNIDCTKGACCLPDGSCMFVQLVVCDVLAGDYQGNGIPCESITCP